MKMNQENKPKKCHRNCSRCRYSLYGVEVRVLLLPVCFHFLVVVKGFTRKQQRCCPSQLKVHLLVLIVVKGEVLLSTKSTDKTRKMFLSLT